MDKYDSLDSAYRAEVRKTLESGVAVSPRGLATLERIGCSLRILDPRARLIFSRARKWSIHYALGELFWHLAGSAERAVISHYASSWRRYSNEALVRGSCYGHTIFTSVNGKASRWETAKNVLRHDPESRRAVIFLSPVDPAFSAEESDVACASTLQFLVRDHRLNLITYMRSNDQILGFGYDVFLFTMLQELMAVELGVELGWYEHIIGSTHIYRESLDLASQIASENDDGKVSAMPGMANANQIARVLHYEALLRTASATEEEMKFDVGPYWNDMLLILLFYRAKKLNEARIMKSVLSRLEGSCYVQLLR